MKETFYFGVPLIAQSAARDWALVDELLGWTLGSVLTQSDRDFRLILAGHDVPPIWRRLTLGDPRFEFVSADWPPEPPNLPNDDGGRKKWLIKDRVRQLGGGLLMFLDADDLVDCDLIAMARNDIEADMIGGIVRDGIALDYVTGRAAVFPVGGGFDHPFHGLCGSSTVARVRPESDDSIDVDPHLALGSHHEWQESAARLGRRLASLPVWGAYVVGTSQNHSENEGPFADWRREFTEHVRETGTPLNRKLASRFGIPAPGDFHSPRKPRRTPL